MNSDNDGALSAEDASPARAGKSRYVRRLLSITLSGATIAILIWLLDVEKVLSVLATGNWLVLGAATIIGIIAQVFAGWRLKAVLEALGCAIPFGDMQKIHFASLWFNQVLPTGLGGDAVRVVSLKAYFGWSNALRGVVLDRVYGVAFLFLICAVQTPLFFWLVEPAAIAAAFAAIGLGGLALLAIVVVAIRHLRCFFHRSMQALAVAVDDFRRLALAKPSRSLLASSLVFPLLSILSFALVGASLHVEVAFSAYLAFVPLVFVVMQFPISYGGWGPRELATILFFSQAGVSSEQAFAMAALFGLVLTASALPGIVVLLMHGVPETHRGRAYVDANS